jgi:hypothetical protein
MQEDDNALKNAWFGYYCKSYMVSKFNW